MPADTKGMILNAFYEIAGKKTIDKITVKDLVTVCGITRQTFYYHFQDIIDVIECALKQISKELLEKTLQVSSPREALRILVSSATEHPEIINSLMGSQKREQAEKLLLSMARSFFQALLEEKGADVKVGYSDMDTALTFYSYAILGVLLENSKKKNIDTDRLADQLYSLICGDMIPSQFHNL